MTTRVCPVRGGPGGYRGLSMQWISPGTPRMQAAARAGTPAQLAARNITVRVDSLWRQPAAVGA